MKRWLQLAAAAVWVCTRAGLADEAPAPDAATRFRAFCAELAGLGDGMTIAGKDGWLFLRNEIRHLGAGRFWGEEAARVSRAAKPELADPFDAIVDFHGQLERLGIRLIVLPVPAKAVVYPEQLPDSPVPVGEDGLPSRLDMVHQEFYAALHDCGVTVLDLLPALMQGRRDPAKPVFCRQDSHWSGQACVLAARQLADRIRKLDWYEGVPKTPFATTEEAVTVVGDLLAGVADAAVRTETLTLRRVGDRPIEPDRDSPVLLMGDSHCLVFHAGGDMLAQGAGLADQLAAELGFAVDLLGVRGSGARPARIALYRRASQPGYIAKKRVVIWCFAAREFTEADGWGKVPVVR